MDISSRGKKHLIFHKNSIKKKMFATIGTITFILSFSIFVHGEDPYMQSNEYVPQLEGIYTAGSEISFRNPQLYGNTVLGWRIPYSGSEYVDSCTWVIFDADMKIVSSKTHHPFYAETIYTGNDDYAGDYLWEFYDTYTYSVPSTFTHKRGDWHTYSYFTLINGIIMGCQWQNFTVDGSFIDDLTGNIFMSVSPIDICVCIVFISFIAYLLPFVLSQERRPVFDRLQYLLKKKKLMGNKKKVTRKQQTIAILLVFILFALMTILVMVF